MRDGILRISAGFRYLLSDDLGAIGGRLFDTGSGRHPAPALPGTDTAAARAARHADLAAVRGDARAEKARAAAEQQVSRTPADRPGCVTWGLPSASPYGSPPTTGTARTPAGAVGRVPDHPALDLAFSRVADLQVRYLPCSDLDRNREAIMRFGRGLHPIEQLARDLA